MAAGVAVASLVVLSLIAGSTPLGDSHYQLFAAAGHSDEPIFTLGSPATDVPAYDEALLYMPIPTPTLTVAPKATPAPAKKPAPAKYRDTVRNAKAYAKKQLGTKQYGCVNIVWWHESKWDPRASNPSGAYGIPQAKPGINMRAFGSNWRYSPLTQVKWGLWYVKDRYGSACGAWAFWRQNGWY